MGNDLFETIRQHYNGIDLDRLYKWCEVAYQKAAHDEGINLRFGLFIELTKKQMEDDKLTPNMLANKIKYNNGYLQAVAMIYGEIAEKEEQIAADLETLSKCRDICVATNTTKKRNLCHNMQLNGQRCRRQPTRRQRYQIGNRCRRQNRQTPRY